MARPFGWFRPPAGGRTRAQSARVPDRDVASGGGAARGDFGLGLALRPARRRGVGGHVLRTFAQFPEQAAELLHLREVLARALLQPVLLRGNYVGEALAVAHGFQRL